MLVRRLDKVCEIAQLNLIQKVKVKIVQSQNHIETYLRLRKTSMAELLSENN